MDFSLLENLLGIRPVENPAFFERDEVVQFSAKFSVDSSLAWGKFSTPKEYSLKRYNEFLAGRYCIHKALNVDYPLAISERKGPKWPEGVCGSLTHAGDYVSVMVSNTLSFKSIGRDSEEIFTPKTAGDLESLIITPSEKKIISKDFEKTLTLIYSAKECLFKALYPLTGTFFNFLDAEFLNIYAHSRSFKVRLKKDLNAKYPKGMVFEGNFEFSNEFVHSVILVPAE